jgi:hypothetical protein
MARHDTIARKAPPKKTPPGMPPTSSAPTPGSRRRNTPVPILGLIFLRFADDAFGKHLRILPRQVRPEGGPEGRRVLHADQHRAADRRDHRALPRPHLRPRLRLGRHVRAVGALRAAPPEERRPRADRVRHREGQRHRQAGQDEPRRAWPVGRHPRGGNTYYEDPHKAPATRPVRLRDGQSAVQRLGRGQGPAEGRPPLPLRPADAPTTPTTCGSSSSTRR